MKKLLLTLIVSIAFYGSIIAQHASHWPEFVYKWENQSALCAAIAIDGHVYTIEDEGWNELEVAFFVNVNNVEEMRGYSFLDPEGVELYDAEYPSTNGAAIAFNTPGDEVHFKLWDHLNGVLYEECEVTYLDEPMTIITGVEHMEEWYDEPYAPIILNFISAKPSYTLDITGYGESEKGGYYLIASPLAEDVTPTADNGFLTQAYDLYYFNQSEDLEWRNYKAQTFNITNGKGYLYASQANTTLTFTGTPYSGDGKIELVRDEENASFVGWNLVGNPFPDTAYLECPFYTMNGDASEITIAEGNSVEPMHGVFVIAENDGDVVTFLTEKPSKQREQLVMNVTKSRGTVIDRAIVSFGDRRQMPKFQLSENSTKVYIQQEGNDFSSVSVKSNMGEMPVNFKAETNGTYSLNFGTENVQFNHLRLIDNKTGNEVDLLQTPSYTFEALTTDYESRFKLVFEAKENSQNHGANDDFAFISNGELIVTGEGTLQVIDMLGHVLFTHEVTSDFRLLSSVFSPDVYVLRLINGNDVKTQKLVVK